MGISNHRHRKSYPEVYALLWLSSRCEANIRDFLISWGVQLRAVERRMHLTVYYARRILSGLPTEELSRNVSIQLDVSETRFMTFAIGGEVPQQKFDPHDKSVGIRLTKRNTAIEPIQELRREMYEKETPEVIGNRKKSTAWKSCFGPPRYQPHIKLIKPQNGLEKDLTDLGAAFRSCFRSFEFDRYSVKTNMPDRVSR